jgi:FMN phosphatase YigB (HAD superfamily)
VGDSLTSDIRGGRNAGIRTCWLNPTGEIPRSDIIPDYTVRTLEELPALFETL